MQLTTHPHAERPALPLIPIAAAAAVLAAALILPTAWLALIGVAALAYLAVDGRLRRLESPGAQPAALRVTDGGAFSAGTTERSSRSAGAHRVLDGGSFERYRG